MGEADLVVDSILQNGREIALVVDEQLGTLRRAEGGDVVSIHGPHTIGEAYVAQANNLLWVDKVDEAVG